MLASEAVLQRIYGCSIALNLVEGDPSCVLEDAKSSIAQTRSYGDPESAASPEESRADV
jgi:hypothetical protein